MKISLRVATLAAMLSVFALGCGEHSPTLAPTGLTSADGAMNTLGALAISVTSVNGVSGAHCADLFAGQTSDAGDVCVSIVGTEMCVTYTTQNDWELVEAHVWVGTSLADMPQTKTGNPKVGNFPYRSTGEPICLDLSQFGTEEELCALGKLFVAAHAVVRKDNGDGTHQTETSWGDGDRIVEKGNWATVMTIGITCGPEPPEPSGCETAFAGGGDYATCFIEADFDEDGVDDGFNRWGWSIGPLEEREGSYTFKIHAGAGQCDTSKGTPVGELTVNYNGGTATVTYSLSPGFTLEETHVYVGSDPLPTDNGEFTVAPGQYGNTHDLNGATTDSCTVSGLSGGIYVVAHAVVCW